MYIIQHGDNMKDYNFKTHTKTNLGIFNKRDKEVWSPYYQMYLGGNSFRELSRILGMDWKSIKKHFLNLGFDVLDDRTKVGGIFISRNDKEAWLPYYKMYMEGRSFRDLSKLLSLSKNSIRKIFLDLGYSLKTREETMSEKALEMGEFRNLDRLDKLGYELCEPYVGISEKSNKSIWTKYDFKCVNCSTVFKSSFSGGFSKTKCPKCYPPNFSAGEDLIRNLICELCIDNKTHHLKDGKHIDIFIPSLNIGFEYNGLYWHSSAHKGKFYHRDKTSQSYLEGIKLYHIWESDNEYIVKSMIMAKLGKTDNVVYARKLKIREVDVSSRRLFFKDNHLHGDVNAKFAIGLYCEDELVSCISFRKHEEGMEIARFATKLNSSVIGGFSRLLKHSIIRLKESGYSKIITYCNRDWTPDYRDSVYYKSGFTFIKDTGCILKYTKGTKVYPREVLQKHKLKKLFPESYSDIKTADEILTDNSIYAFYNSGNWKFELVI